MKAKPGARMNRIISVLVFLVLIAVLAVVSYHNYLLFHGLVEIFSITIAGAIFIIAWNSRGYLKNNYVIITGSYYFIIGIRFLIGFFDISRQVSLLRL